MANICSVELVLYTDKNNLENLERAKKAILDDEEKNFIVDIMDAKIVRLGELYYCHYCGWCKWALRYDLVNEFAKKYNVRWASVEEESGLDHYVINDEEGFFNDYVYYIDESSYSFGDYYSEFDKMFEVIKTALNQETIEETMKKIDNNLDKCGVCYLDYDDVDHTIYPYEDEFFFKINNYTLDNSNFWWNFIDKNILF